MEREITAANLCDWARETLVGYDRDLGLRDSIAGTTCPPAAREAVLRLAQDALWLVPVVRDTAARR